MFKHLLKPSGSIYPEHTVCRPQAWTVDNATWYGGLKMALNTFVVHYYIVCQYLIWSNQKMKEPSWLAKHYIWIKCDSFHQGLHVCLMLKSLFCISYVYPFNRLSLLIMTECVIVIVFVKILFAIVDTKVNKKLKICNV